MNSANCQILQVGMLLDRGVGALSEQPTLEFNVDNGTICGEHFALTLNAGIIGDIAQYGGIKPAQISGRIWQWMEGLGVERGHVFNLGGKNVSFDVGFLSKVRGFGTSGSQLVGKYWRTRSRYVDPGILYTKWNNESVPGTNDCLKRAEIVGGTDHKALSDCMLCAALVRKALGCTL